MADCAGDGIGVGVGAGAGDGDSDVDGHDDGDCFRCALENLILRGLTVGFMGRGMRRWVKGGAGISCLFENGARWPL